MGTIVVCDDDPLVRRLIAVALRTTSHRLHVAANGEECLALVARERPSLVLLDVALPRLDGLAVADQLKAQPDLASIPIVFITASAQPQQVAEGYRHGAAAYLVKPFSVAELREMVTRFAGDPGPAGPTGTP